MWNVPILTFIEHKSLSMIFFFKFLLVLYKIFVVFEPDEDEKNEKEYKKIHDDYKNLVIDILINAFRA